MPTNDSSIEFNIERVSENTYMHTHTQAYTHAHGIISRLRLNVKVVTAEKVVEMFVGQRI